MKTQIIQKLTSRKFWAAIVGVIIGVAAAFGIDSNEYAQIAGIVTSAISIFGYMFIEGKVDAERVKNVVTDIQVGEIVTEVRDGESE